jgi:pimeloyl-ACP methyl ester carboxylesterase/tetratricopeptide (TPR) repeat protein
MDDKTKSVAIPGGKERPIDETDKEAQDIFSVEHYASYEVPSDRSAGSKTAVEKDVQADDVLELSIDGEIAVFVRRDDYERSYKSSSRSSNENELLIGRISAGRPSRGMREWVVKALDFFRVPAAKQTGRMVCDKFESKTIEKPGLNRVLASSGSSDAAIQLVPASLSDAQDKPLLVFIHGTASNTEGSFGELFKNSSLYSRLRNHYGSSIYAFEHRTLTLSPIDNAIELANSLPKHAKVHLVSHSRGGLVGELLCRGTKENGGAFSEEELSFYKKRSKDVLEDMDDEISKGAEETYNKQLASLKQLSDVLADKHISVDRFVRVACPARGTTLASGRLDRWLSVVFNLIGFVPALRATPYYSLLKNFIVALVNTRTNPQVLPGLEAQMPGSPLISLLNVHHGSLKADLTVISGDIEKQGVLGRIAAFFTDNFYEDQHDLVVNTSSMFGGGKRTDTPRYFFDQGNNVSHFNYFRNLATSQRVLHGLTSNETLLAQNFKQRLPELRRPIARSARERAASGPRPIVYVLPGILGSELSVHEKTIWADHWNLINGGLGKLTIDNEHVKPSDVIGSAYDKLIEFLDNDYEVIPFYYDWRLPLATEAKRLSESISKSVARNKQDALPVSIIAHSMGGLVVRMMIANQRETWNDMLAHKNSRFIMLGTPSQGSYSIPRVLLGHEKLVKLLALIDLRNSRRDILKIIGKYPGILNMLPTTDSGMDLFADSVWQQIAATGRGNRPVPDAEQLQQAKDTRALLDTVVFSNEESGRVLYVAGKASATPVSISIEKDKIKFQATADGDGRVPWNTGIPNGVASWYTNVVHGDLANHEPSFAAYKELLEKGTTALLSTDRPTRSRGVPDIFDMPADEVQYQPNEADISRAALGASSETIGEAAPEKKISVKVTHGDLIFARHPVAVGHYYNHGIYSAEAALDERLGKKLSTRHSLGLYPGRLNTCLVVIDRDSKPGGAIIIGMGDVGNLTVSSLTNAYTQAMKEYVLKQKECEANVPIGDGEEPLSSLGVSTVIIGSGNGGMAVIDCIQAIIEGVINANSALKNQDEEKARVVDSIEIIELWEDVAIHATKELHRLLKVNTLLAQRVACEKLLNEGEGSRYRSLYSEEDDWWQRMQIRETDDFNLTFKTISNYARNEYRLFPTDKAKIDRFIQRATAATATNNNLPKTLFEMLVPNEMKKVASNGNDTILLLNEGSARYPWELLQDRWGDAGGPPATKFKILRQLESKYFTEQPAPDLNDTAMVVGAPKLGEKWSELPGAIDEAKLVTSLLSSNQFDTVSLIEPDGFDIFDQLYIEAYKIMHLAGHGVYNYRLESATKTCNECGSKVGNGNIQSGMVISDNQLLTPADIEKIRFVPELVFINCCHLGGVERQPEHAQFPSIAANLATQFIRKGARAVVAAGWEVDDQAALRFANVFYTSMLEGENFGTAVLRARQETYHRHPSVNTWGAYQCYGNPEYRIRSNHPHSHQQEDWPFVSANELVMTLRSLSNEARTKAKEEEFNALANKLEHILASIKANAPQWLDLGSVCSSLADVYRELARFDEAIQWYKKSLSAEDARVYVHAAEQLGNIVIRQAVIKAFKDDASKKDILACHERIIKTTEQLHALTNLFPDQDLDAKAVTVERLNILGSAYKRQALMAKLLIQRKLGGTRVKAIQDALEEMEHFYLGAAWVTPESDKAFDQSNPKRVTINNLWSGSEHPRAYAYLNYIAAKVLREQLLSSSTVSSLQSPVIDARDKHHLDELLKMSLDSDRDEPSFWDMATGADAMLLKALVDKKLVQRRIDVLELYQKAIARGASKRQTSTILENLKAIAELYDPNVLNITGRKTERKDIHTALNMLVSELEK